MGPDVQMGVRRCKGGDFSSGASPPATAPPEAIGAVMEVTLAEPSISRVTLIVTARVWHKPVQTRK